MAMKATAQIARRAAVWSRKHAAYAAREGWGLFSTGGEFGPFEIERDDDSGVFANDARALAYVVYLAEQGSKRAFEALTIAAVSHDLTVTDWELAYKGMRP
jgi:hypothetical protein